MPIGGENLIRLIDPASGLTISGRLTILRSGVAEVKGVAEGIDIDNYYSLRPDSIHGTSSQWGEVWLNRVYKFEPTISPKSTIPAIIRLRAIEIFHGAFDPREAVVRAASASLGRLTSLFPFQPFQQQVHENRTLTRSYKLIAEPASLYKSDEVEISLQHLANIGMQVSYKQILLAAYRNDTTASAASAVLDNALLLISVLVQSNVRPRTITYTSLDGKQAAEKRAFKKRSKPLMPHEWLSDQYEIASLLPRAMGSWLKALAVKEVHALVQWFMTAAHSERTVESRFLLFCQCFEELNRRRIGKCRHDPEIYARDIISPLRSAIASLDAVWIKSDVRSRLRAAIKAANDRPLRDRVSETMALFPQFMRTVKEGINNIRTRIEQRRNSLSHGNPSGAVTHQDDFKQFDLELSVIRALCLAELLLLTGIDHHEIDKLVLADKRMRHFSWRIFNT